MWWYKNSFYFYSSNGELPENCKEDRLRLHYLTDIASLSTEVQEQDLIYFVVWKFKCGLNYFHCLWWSCGVTRNYELVIYWLCHCRTLVRIFFCLGIKSIISHNRLLHRFFLLLLVNITFFVLIRDISS